jgi:hypothetical protein
MEEMVMSTPSSGPDRDWEPQELSAGHREPCTYVTEVSVPYFGDGGVQRLYAPMKQPEPEPEAESNPGSLPVSQPGQPGPEVVPEPEASL